MGDEMNNLTPRCLEMAPRVAEIMGPWEPKYGDDFLIRATLFTVIQSTEDKVFTAVQMYPIPTSFSEPSHRISY